MLSLDHSVVLIVDVQARLAQAMTDRESLLRNLQILIRGAQILQVPILWVEQNPAGLGPTVPEVAELLSSQQPIPKLSFSACGAPQLMRTLEASGRRQVLLAGIEAHVCVYLTAIELLKQGYEVEVVADAVTSRSATNKQIALQKMAARGAGISCTETVLFELLGRAEGDPFKQILRLVC
jgi:nicotinamidase-related amidase